MNGTRLVVGMRKHLHVERESVLILAGAILVHLEAENLMRVHLLALLISLEWVARARVSRVVHDPEVTHAAANSAVIA